MGSESFPIEITPVDIASLADGNVGIPYVHRFESGRAGPHVLVNALTHGNELCGAHALAFLFEHGVRPSRGTLTLSFANVAAYERFDPRQPTASRYIDEDLNRVWARDVLDGPRQSRELARARELRPIVEAADSLLDIHSMQHDSEPLMLCGLAAKGRRLAQEVGYPAHIVADAGHEAGMRMRDYGDFADPAGAKAALLVECGQHWSRQCRGVAIETTLRFLHRFGMVDDGFLADHLDNTGPCRQCLIEVTGPVTISSERFYFTQDYCGLEVIPEAGTVIGFDGEQPVKTPYDDCVLIMPSRRIARGQTAVRFGRFVA